MNYRKKPIASKESLWHVSEPPLWGISRHKVALGSATKLQCGKRRWAYLFSSNRRVKVAIVGAGFTPPETDQFRRAMATFQRTGSVSHFYDKLVGGMVARDYPKEFAERSGKQIEGFGSYGLPESHAFQASRSCRQRPNGKKWWKAAIRDLC